MALNKFNLTVTNQIMAMANPTNFENFFAERLPSLNIGDTVVWLGGPDPTTGVVKWTGRVARSMSKLRFMAWIEMDDPSWCIKSSSGEADLGMKFGCSQGRGKLVSVDELILFQDYFDDLEPMSTNPPWDALAPSTNSKDRLVWDTSPEKTRSSSDWEKFGPSSPPQNFLPSAPPEIGWNLPTLGDYRSDSNWPELPSANWNPVFSQPYFPESSETFQELKHSKSRDSFGSLGSEQSQHSTGSGSSTKEMQLFLPVFRKEPKSTNPFHPNFNENKIEEIDQKYQTVQPIVQPENSESLSKVRRSVSLSQNPITSSSSSSLSYQDELKRVLESKTTQKKPIDWQSLESKNQNIEKNTSNPLQFEQRPFVRNFRSKQPEVVTDSKLNPRPQSDPIIKIPPPPTINKSPTISRNRHQIEGESGLKNIKSSQNSSPLGHQVESPSKNPQSSRNSAPSGLTIMLNQMELENASKNLKSSRPRPNANQTSNNNTVTKPIITDKQNIKPRTIKKPIEDMQDKNKPRLLPKPIRPKTPTNLTEKQPQNPVKEKPSELLAPFVFRPKNPQESIFIYPDLQEQEELPPPPAQTEQEISQDISDHPLPPPPMPLELSLDILDCLLPSHPPELNPISSRVVPPRPPEGQSFTPNQKEKSGRAPQGEIFTQNQKEKGAQHPAGQLLYPISTQNPQEKRARPPQNQISTPNLKEKGIMPPQPPEGQIFTPNQKEKGPRPPHDQLLNPISTQNRKAKMSMPPPPPPMPPKEEILNPISTPSPKEKGPVTANLLQEIQQGIQLKTTKTEDKNISKATSNHNTMNAAILNAIKERRLNIKDDELEDSNSNSNDEEQDSDEWD